MDAIYITQQAAESMWEQSQGCSTETGGPLVGTLQIPMVLIAGEPGPHAVKMPHFFSTDPEYDRQMLNRAREKYGRKMHLLGYWHKHPEGMNHPSPGDLRQARKLAADLRDVGEQHAWLLTFILQSADNPEQAIFPYLLSPDMENFQKISLIVVKDDSDEVRQALESEGAVIVSNRIDHPWADPDFRFQFTPVGRSRLEWEQQVLEQAGYKVEVRQRKSDQRISFLLSNERSQYLCIFPVEYPLNMPRLYVLPDKEEIFPLRARSLWNSDFTVADLLANVNQLVAEEPPITTPPTPFPRDLETHGGWQPEKQSWRALLIAIASGLAIGLTWQCLNRWQKRANLCNPVVRRAA